MGKDWKKWAADKGLYKWFKRDNFIILVLAGILLIIIALPTKDSDNANVFVPEPDSAGNAELALLEADTDEAYAALLEERLTEALSRMAGVGKVKVMITLKCSRELVVDKEQPVSRSTTNESDFQGGNRIVSQMETEENTVYRTEGNTSEPYVIKSLPPQIEGVLVVAEGAGNGTINRTIVEVVQALFGVEAHKVQVVKMEAEEK